ncbi:MAG: TetR/AcrR family transcriptional regulator [Planctomycetota bacterium]
MPPPDGDTRAKLLETAARLFHEQGYEATGISTILRESGVNAGSLYHFFKNKEDLLRGTLEWRLVELRPQVTDPVEAATGDPVERVFELLGQYRQMLEMTGCTMGCPVGNLALELADSHPDIRPLIHANFENWLDVVGGWIEAAGERLPADLDRRELARFVLTTMEGGIMQARASGTLAPFDQSVAHLRRYFQLLLQHASSPGTTP